MSDPLRKLGRALLPVLGFKDLLLRLRNCGLSQEKVQMPSNNYLGRLRFVSRKVSC